MKSRRTGMAEKKYEFEETMVTLVDEDGKEKPFMWMRCIW